MKDSFQPALKEVLKSEGGYVNHPLDPGGATNKGITQATYDAFRGARKQSVKLITDAEVASIYKARYWDAVKGDQLPAGLDYAVFDFAVNSGPARSAHFLQTVLGVSPDGSIGPKTLQAVLSSDVPSVIRKLCQSRLAWLKLLKTWSTFGKGWERRVTSVQAIALQWASRAPTAPSVPQATPVAPTPTKPATDDQKPSKGLFAWLRSLFT